MIDIVPVSVALRRKEPHTKVYVACPYTDELPSVMQWRYEQVTIFSVYLLLRDVLPFSPISTTHHLVKFGMGVFFDAWERFDLSWMEWADELWVLCLPGWELSVGVAREIEFAESAGMTIRYIEWSPDAHPWAENEGE